MDQGILVLNAGSSSVKFALYRLAPQGPERTLKGEASGLGAMPRLKIKMASGETHQLELPAGADQASALALILEWLDANGGGVKLIGVGHRVVHGGPDYAEPLRLDDKVLSELDAFCTLAPLHQPHNLTTIRAVMARRPDLPQVACFDTAFHRSQPPVAQRYALPRKYVDQGILRYGFHGLSYEYIAETLPALDADAAHGRVIVAHLGAGASMAAVSNGRGVASTMGFTALDGLVMATRCGTIDPGVVLHLIQQEGMSPKEVEDMLYRRSGLLGLSGVSSDMRLVLESDTDAAREAVESFVYQAQLQIGSLTAALGGLDALVFTAGIGENSAVIRERICAGLGWLGVELDAQANAGNGPRISAQGSPTRVWVIPTDEELMIARHTQRLLGV